MSEHEAVADSLNPELSKTSPPLRLPWSRPTSASPLVSLLTFATLWLILPGALLKTQISYSNPMLKTHLWLPTARTIQSTPTSAVFGLHRIPLSSLFIPFWPHWPPFCWVTLTSWALPLLCLLPAMSFLPQIYADLSYTSRLKGHFLSTAFPDSSLRIGLPPLLYIITVYYFCKTANNVD